MKVSRALLSLLFSVMLAASLAGCGSSSNNNGGHKKGAGAYAIGGTVSGLEGSGLVLLHNVSDELVINSPGPFVFNTTAANGEAYDVEVLHQPTNPIQTCSINNGTGTVQGADVTNVAVICAGQDYTVGGTATGITNTVVLQDNGGDDLVLTGDGPFTFTAPVANTAGYDVTILSSPGLGCSLTNATGTVNGSNVTDVTLSCIPVNTAPVADAGPDQSVLTGSVVDLDGSGSWDADGDPLTYRWSFTSMPGGSTAVLLNATTANPTFTADISGFYVLGLIVNDSTADSSADPVTIWASLFPDTGQTLCYDGSGSVMDCSGTGQDGAYSINPMSFTDNGNGTVTDNVTGLMWAQQNSGAATYNWYEASGTADSTFNPGGATDVCGSLTTGGHSDWRLPTKKELLRIVDDGTSSPTIDTVYFPSTATSTYWTSTALASNPASAWYVDFSDGLVDAGAKSGSSYVRCVRGGSFASSFTNNVDGTVSDNVTGLMWARQNSSTATYNWFEASGTPDSTYNPSGAIDVCGLLTAGGYTNWRLPNVKELESITDDSLDAPAVDATYFPLIGALSYAGSLAYATSTSYPGDKADALSVHFSYGYVNHYVKSSSFWVVCVRGGS